MKSKKYLAKADGLTVGLGIGVILCILWLIASFFRGGIYTSILFHDEKDSFMDFFNCIYTFSGNPYVGEEVTNYPPMAIIIYKIFRHAIPEYQLLIPAREMRLYQAPMMVFLFYNVFVINILLFTISQKVKISSVNKTLLMILLSFSFPVLFALERGNLINLAFSLTVFFCGFYDDKNRIKRNLAYIALAIAAAIKIYPAIFGLILLKEKRIKDTLILVVYGIVAFFAPFWKFGGIDAIHSFARGLLGFVNNRSLVTKEGVSNVESNIYNVLPDSYGYNFAYKNIQTVFQHITGIQLPNAIVTTSLFIILIVLLLYAFVSKEKWKSMLSCALIALLVPSFSGAYSTLFLLIPFVEFINCHSNHPYTDNKMDKLTTSYYFVMLALIVPWSLPYISKLSDGTQLRPMSYSYLIYFIIVFHLVLLCFIDIYKKYISNKILLRCLVGMSIGIMTVYTIIILVCCLA